MPFGRLGRIVPLDYLELRNRRGRRGQQCGLVLAAANIGQWNQRPSELRGGIEHLVGPPHFVAHPLRRLFGQLLDAAQDLFGRQTILVETDDPEGPYGAKEAGQGPLLPVVPAVSNALYDAIGVRIHEIPITPDKILRALDGRLKPISVPDFKFPAPIKWHPGEGIEVTQKS